MCDIEDAIARADNPGNPGKNARKRKRPHLQVRNKQKKDDRNIKVTKPTATQPKPEVISEIITEAENLIEEAVVEVSPSPSTEAREYYTPSRKVYKEKITINRSSKEKEDLSTKENMEQATAKPTDKAQPGFEQLFTEEDMKTNPFCVQKEEPWRDFLPGFGLFNKNFNKKEGKSHKGWDNLVRKEENIGLMNARFCLFMKHLSNFSSKVMVNNVISIGDDAENTLVFKTDTVNGTFITKTGDVLELKVTDVSPNLAATLLKIGFRQMDDIVSYTVDDHVIFARAMATLVHKC